MAFADVDPGIVLELLGLQSLAVSLNSVIDVIDLIDRGLSKKCVSRLIGSLGLFPYEVAGVLNITERTLLGWLSYPQQKRLMTPLQSSQLWLFCVVVITAADTLGSERLALEWLRKRQVALNQRRPLDFASTAIGLNEVLHALNQIDRGVYV
jgi:putative toxin-antitoxin system antitoxin component (TIGR02293 family)